MYMYMCVHVYMYVCVCLGIHLCTCAYVCICMRVHVCMCIYLCICVYVLCMYMCKCVCMCIYVYMCVYVCVHGKCVCAGVWGALRRALHVLYHCPHCFFIAGPPCEPGTFSPNVLLSVPLNAGVQGTPDHAQHFMAAGVQIPALMLAQ